MKPDSTDFEIIAAIYHHPRIAQTELAARVGLRIHTFRRRLEALLRAGVMRQKAFPDLYALGFCQYEVSLAIASTKGADPHHFLDALRHSEETAWIGQYSGEYQYSFTLCCRTPQRFYQTLTTLLSRQKIQVVRSQIATRLRYVEFPLRMMSSKVGEDLPIEFGRSGQAQIDSVDHQLLRLLCLDSGMSTRALAQQLGMAQSTLIQRLQGLEERGVLPGYTYVVDFSKLQFQAYCILIKVRSPSNALTEKLYAFARDAENISYFIESFGAYEFKIGVLLRVAAAILPLSQEIAEVLGDELLSMTTLTAFDYLKVERYPFKEFPVK